MSREIKFRAWANGSMWRVNGLACSDGSDSMDLIDDSIGGYEKVSDFDDVESRVLMQYTGLHDKNGKEIYEGDIIACKFHPQFVERINWEQVDIIGKVFWDLCGFSLNARNAEDDRRYPDLVDLNRNESEVIGNIYENPELLKEETA